MCGLPMLLCEEVFHPKAINIKQYLNTNNFSVNNRHFVIKSSQSAQLYTTKVFYKQFSCHGYKTIIFRLKFWYNKHFLIEFNHTIKTLCNTTHLIFYFFLFKNTFVMKGFICFTDIFIYKQLSCHEFIKKKSIFVTNIDKINNF